MILLFSFSNYFPHSPLRVRASPFGLGLGLRPTLLSCMNFVSCILTWSLAPYLHLGLDPLFQSSVWRPSAFPSRGAILVSLCFDQSSRRYSHISRLVRPKRSIPHFLSWVKHPPLASTGQDGQSDGLTGLTAVNKIRSRGGRERVWIKLCISNLRKQKLNIKI